jgi:hypothetical protein
MTLSLTFLLHAYFLNQTRAFLLVEDLPLFTTYLILLITKEF